MEIHLSDLPQEFIDLFTKTLELNEAEFGVLLSHFNRTYLPKRFYYLKEGQITKQKAYIVKGCTRSYTLDSKGGEHILFFAFEDWWIGDFHSYNTGLPGNQYVQAIEDCELLCISKTDFDRLEVEIPKLFQWYEVKQKRMLYSMMQRLTEVKTLTPEERYLNLLKKHPHIFQRVPLQYIASYLDIEPPSLSRLRKRLSGK